MGRNDLCFCGSGKKQKRCHRKVNERSKWANIFNANQEYEDYVQNNGLAGHCLSGCSLCCDAFFSVYEEEFYYILDHICNGDFLKIENKIEKAKEISEHVQKNYPKLWSNLREEMPSTDLAHFDVRYLGETFDLDAQLPRCMFLSPEGKCEIYECRPAVCRVFGTTSPCAVINNPNDKEKTERMFEDHKVIHSRTGKKLIKRPYPLFYWFSYFLDNDIKKYIARTKMQNMKNLSEDAYFQSQHY